jgi:D-alanine-D-alanine ligase
VNEVNPLPGLTPISLFPVLWGKAGLSADQLLLTMMQIGFDRYAKKDEALNHMRAIANEAMKND